MRFDNRNCLVTGGAGFIGSTLVEELVRLGANVTVIDNLVTGSQNLQVIDSLGVKFVKADISDLSSIEGCFEGVEIVFHLAAMNRAQKSIDDPIRANATNVNGTLNCLKLALDCNVKRFVFASSSSVYKGVIGSDLKEDMYLEPPHPYGVGKLAGEHYCRIFNELYGMETVVLRYFSVYGPRQRGDIEYAGVIAKFMEASIQNKELTIYGTGQQTRNFSYVLDVVKGTLLAASNPDSHGKVINISSDKECSVLEVAETLIRITNSKSQLVHLPPIRGDPISNPADISLSRSILNYQPQYFLQKGLQKTVDYYLSNVDS